MTELHYCALPDRGLVRLSGRDARSFLDAQTTQRIADLGETTTAFSAWLSAKGRIRALFDVVPAGDELWLAMAADNAEWLAAELAKYVLRSDVGIELDRERVVHSLVGDARAWLQARGIDLSAARLAQAQGLAWVAIAPERVDVIGEAPALRRAFAGLSATPADAASLAAIAAGRPEVTAAQRDLYIPQMLNLERLGAVSFTKGCYPGQEIVARTQNLGQVKRRIRRFRIEPGARPRPGDGIVDAAGKPAGEVNRAAAAGTGFELLAVVPVDRDPDKLALAADGRVLEPLPLPVDG